jgi:hypothetical protein
MTGTFECMKQPFFLVAESQGLHARACPSRIGRMLRIGTTASKGSDYLSAVTLSSSFL